MDKLATQNKNLQFNKRGNRLEQFMGEDGAKNYLDSVDKAQKAGVSAVKWQQAAKWIGNAAVKLAGFGLAGEAIGHVIP